MATLETRISDLETRELHPMEFYPRTSNLSPEELPERRIERLQTGCGIQLDPPDPSITSVRDFLSEDRRENLVRNCRLDGILHGEVDIKAREAWIEKTEENIRTAERAKVHPDGLPAELKYLMTLVRGICGNGLPHYRYGGELHQLKFLTDVDGEEDEDEPPMDSGYVSVPWTFEEQRQGLGLSDFREEWDDHEVALAVHIGNGGFTAYCQKLKDADDADTWRWKYGLWSPEADFAVYDTVEEFLEFYADFNKEGEEEGGEDDEWDS